MIKSASFSRSLTIQGRVIGALIVRELLTRYGRHNIGFMWLFVEPMMFTLGITAVWSALKLGHSNHVSVAAFALTGYSTLLLWRNCVNRCNLAIGPNLGLLFHRNVRVLDLFLARLVLEIAGATMSLTFLTAIFYTLGMVEAPKDIPLMLGAWGMLIWFSVGLGLTIGSLSERSETVERVWHTVTYLMFPLSGAAFRVAWLPTALKNVVLWVPMVHGSEMLRDGYFGGGDRTYYDLGYFAVFNLILLLVGLLLTREAGRRVEPA